MNVCISVISSALTIRLFGSATLGLTAAIIIMAILMFGEVLPKQFAIRNNEGICIHASRIIRGFSILFLPIIAFINGFSSLFTRHSKKIQRDSVTSDSILRMVKYAETAGNLETYKTKMVQSVFRFSDITVHAIMTHRQKVFSLSQNLSVKEAVPLVTHSRFSRIPLYENDPENITGVVLEKDLIRLSVAGKLENSLISVANPPVFIPETWNINRVFRKLKGETLNIGIVLDEYGGLAGIVTMEDLVEEIIGELYDEDEEPEEVKILKDPQGGWYRIQGDAPVRLLEELVGTSIPHDRSAETVGGYILQQLSALPVKGQTVETDIGTFIINSMSHKQVKDLRYRPREHVIQQ